MTAPTTNITTDEPQRPGTLYRTELFVQLGLIDLDGIVVDVGGRDGRFLGAVGAERGVVVDMEVAAREPSVRYVGGSGLDLPLATGCADTVLSFDVIEHVPDDKAFVAELVRIARPGAQIVLTTPNDDIRILPGPAQSFIDRSWGHHRVRGYAPDALSAMFEAAGVAEVSVIPVAMAWYRRLYVPMRLAWSLSGALGRRLVTAAARRDAKRAPANHGFCLVVARR